MRSGYVKKALIRDDSVPVGQPAPMHLVCVCGTRVSIEAPFSGTATSECQNCHTIYNDRGWLIEKEGG